MDQKSPGERLRAAFASDLKRLNGLLDVGGKREAQVLARQIAPRVHLAVQGERAAELYEKLKIIAGCGRFPARTTRPAA